MSENEPAPELSPAEAIPQLALTLKAAGDPLRLEILRLLSQDSYSVLELCRIFDLRQPALSHHLKVLAQAGLVNKHREGNNLFYRRTAATPLLAQLFTNLDHLPLADVRVQAVSRISEERAEASRRFFADYGNRFREQQELIASYDVYGPQVAQLLKPGRHALEVGPGEGEFLQELAQRFATVTALDLSSAMLERAQSFADEQGIKNIEFVCSDTRAAAARPASADTIVVNMVLHHTPDPAQIFHDLHGALKKGGQLLIAELQEHSQDWAREACGDLWLGFAPEQLSDWAATAGLQDGRSIYSALRNGFQIQIREFIKP
ncbi:metalloregulator ArsR/SmtB family transcription factor [Microbulbifer sp. EKSA008]|uniref:metalloregulator ArsR/SmtB family transcription factor n=1 Tax=unclassified Microbulbifer TaxID=2619833 RepID=UPI000D52E9C5|nr:MULTISPECIES: metalloregulator ArsR/SmtB family transcription factor [unclassified Microbulbifer]AWF83156.1 ArsR family transcriptional regulator [Microbulbifer sp. A4B17]WHI44981.1 metalloregulator ArsR/SmtB family transcription factor [Microbulbifer sp. VAAF005]WNZ56250.1 metalloregulator ArsR/SmtB family transcription factor [Microbulbifer sp. MKSA007]